MRRYLAATVAVSALFFAAACSSDTGGGTSTAATPAPGGATSVDPSAAAAGDKALSSDTKAICAQAGRTVKSFGETFASDLKMKATAAGQGSEAKTAAQQKTDRDVQNFSGALASMAGLTSDPRLRGALTAMVTQVTQVKGDVTKLDAAKMAQLTGSLDTVCGKA